jgi:hypothetical protein
LKKRFLMQKKINTPKLLRIWSSRKEDQQTHLKKMYE